MAKVCTNFCGFLHRVCFAVAVCFVSLFCVNGAWAGPDEFFVTTVELAAGDVFEFSISAQGTYVVDCGEGGTLSGTGVSHDNIDHTSNTTAYTYTCTYDTDGVKTIAFAGDATLYGMSYNAAAISFYTSSANAAKVAEISGDLSSIFPYLGSNLTQQPKFYRTFGECINLREIPDTLFGYTTVGAQLFSGTFYRCTGLTEIPENLFANITTSADHLFIGTFEGCTGLTEIPERLFAFGGNNVSGQSGMFDETFKNCTGLTEIPENLFANITTGADNMFAGTFEGCRQLTEIPGNLFANITTGAAYMFNRTFRSCNRLTEIPENLFAFGGNNVSGQSGMFDRTFESCGGLTELPENLFANITTVAQDLFSFTFSSCSGLTGIPPGLFDNFSGAPARNMFYGTFDYCSRLTSFGDKTYVPGDFLANINTNTSVSNQATNMFRGTQLNDPCPAGTYASTRQQFNDAGKPWCSECPAGTTSPAGSTSASQCVTVYTVSFVGGDSHNNGTGVSATGSTASITTYYGATVTLPSNGFTAPSGLHFAYWSCNYNVGDKSAGQTFTMPGANVTCTARWAYSVSYKCRPDSETVVASSDAMYGSSFTALGDNICLGFPGYPTYSEWLLYGTQLPRIQAGGTVTWINEADTILIPYWEPGTYAVTLRNYNDSATHNIIYETYTVGWYSDSSATTSINTAPLPTRSGYTFRGFYTTTQADLTANGGSGTRIIDASGALPFNTTYNTDANLYAAWARDCDPGANCTCLLTLNDNGTVTYQTGANVGYSVTSGGATYAPVCSANNISLSFDNSSTSCTYGSTFNVPTPAVRTGYVFTGWKINQPECSLVDSVCGLDASAISSLSGVNLGGVALDGQGTPSAATYGLTSPGTWAVEFSNGDIARGRFTCTDIGSNMFDTVMTELNNGTMTQQEALHSLWGSCDSDALQPSSTLSVTGTGQYCWCKMDSYTPNGAEICDLSYSSWVFYPMGEQCSERCIEYCVYFVYDSSMVPDFTMALFGVSQ